jgi:hypothetical protein
MVEKFLRQEKKKKRNWKHTPPPKGRVNIKDINTGDWYIVVLILYIVM